MIGGWPVCLTCPRRQGREMPTVRCPVHSCLAYEWSSGGPAADWIGCFSLTNRRLGWIIEVILTVAALGRQVVVQRVGG